MTVELSKDGAIATVTLNRPERKNALTWEMRQQLTRYFTELRFDDDIRAIIVTGAGGAFCSGADVGNMGGRDLRKARQMLQSGSHAYIRVLHNIEKPVIAAVEGVAVGIGMSIAMACDMMVVGRSARFAQVFQRIGLAPDGGGIWLLVRRIGTLRAKELVYGGRFVGAEEAVSLGIANHVTEDGGALAKARELAEQFAAGPTFALGLSKKLFNLADGPSLEDYLEMEAMVQPQLNNTADHKEGVAAFKEKRKPNFTGR
jgi:2-(1,2-epoxy-1,2-dihydrophenyl)acetyl-CoA isomerase